MKVGPLTESVRYLNQVHEKREAADQGGQHSGQQHQNSGKKDQNHEVFEITDEKVGAAIETFRQDSQARANGLEVEMNGRGPGLRVTLKDGSGAIVRQFSGEEFLRMREAVKQGNPRGKILDQKI